MYLGAIWALLALVGFLHHVGTLVEVEILVGVGVLLALRVPSGHGLYLVVI